LKIVIRFRLGWDAEQLPTKLFELMFSSFGSYEENKSNFKNKISKTIKQFAFARKESFL
jgi:hypothetical protein